jgi:hypothetical protein
MESLMWEGRELRSLHMSPFVAWSIDGLRCSNGERSCFVVNT